MNEPKAGSFQASILALLRDRAGESVTLSEFGKIPGIQKGMPSEAFLIMRVDGAINALKGAGFLIERIRTSRMREPRYRLVQDIWFELDPLYQDREHWMLEVARLSRSCPAYAIAVLPCWCSQNHPEERQLYVMTAGFLACAKCGRNAVPVYPENPRRLKRN